MKIETGTLLIGVLALVGVGVVVVFVTTKNNANTPQSNLMMPRTKNSNPESTNNQLFVDTRTGRFPVYSEADLIMLAEVADGYRSGASYAPSVPTVSTQIDGISPTR